MTPTGRRATPATQPTLLKPLIAAKAGIHEQGTSAIIASWVPTFAGTSGRM